MSRKDFIKYPECGDSSTPFELNISISGKPLNKFRLVVELSKKYDTNFVQTNGNTTHYLLRSKV